MSRSYKKAPVCTDYSRKTTKYWKRQANHKVRRHQDVMNGKSYRKVYESWKIHDYAYYESKIDAITWYEKHENDIPRWFKDVKNLDDYLNKYWAHDFLRK